MHTLPPAQEQLFLDGVVTYKDGITLGLISVIRSQQVKLTSQV